MPTPRWAPAEVLDLDGISSGFTCVGYAKSKGRKCRNAISYDNRQEAIKLLSEMSRLDPQSPTIDNKLEELASRLLCKRNHRNQAIETKGQWQRRIEHHTAEVARGEEEEEAEAGEHTHPDPQPSSPLEPTSSETHHHEHSPSPISLPAEELASRIPGAFPREVEGEHTHTDPQPSSPLESTSSETHHHEHSPSPISLPAEELASQIPGAFPREVEEDDCSICCEELLGDGDIVYCRAQCRQNVHADCINLWHASQEVDGRTKTCPYW
ncbi:hypothetical protein IMSHALPRED_010574 [Imshaugia aleurites]|uniref:RING-type domain-containing protein n=1 Tax=Imshaugia aleurites TaxID=172621 RepID=A0A8H3I8W8_9LECA|nr:hypothetical protein IMSHALPRED_010574 [Imshaugia aleurites]